MRFVLGLLILTIIVISGCEKQSDYRNKYLGNWLFEIQSQTVKDGGIIVNSYTSIYNGEIKYGEGTGEILLQFQETNYHPPVTLRIGQDGKILPKTYSSYPSIHLATH